MTSPTAEERAAELLAKATPGPWVMFGALGSRWVGPADEYGTNPYGSIARLIGKSAGNAELIAAAPQLITDLLSELERVRSALSSVLGEVRGLSQETYDHALAAAASVRAEREGEG